MSEDSMYFETIEEAAEYVEDMAGHKVKADMNSIRKALSDFEDEHKEEKWMYYNFHEFKLTD